MGQTSLIHPSCPNLVKTTRQKEMSRSSAFSNWLISNFLSPNLILQQSLHLVLFDEGCLVCSSLSMYMHPCLKWQNHSKCGCESWLLLKSNFIICSGSPFWSSVQNLIYRHCYIFLNITYMKYNTSTTVH